MNEVVMLRFRDEAQWSEAGERFGFLVPGGPPEAPALVPAPGVDVIGALDHPTGATEVVEGVEVEVREPSEGWHVNIVFPEGEFLPESLDPFVVVPERPKRQFAGQETAAALTGEAYSGAAPGPAAGLPETPEAEAPPADEDARAARETRRAAILAARTALFLARIRVDEAIREATSLNDQIAATIARRDAFPDWFAAAQARRDALNGRISDVPGLRAALAAARVAAVDRLRLAQDARRAAADALREARDAPEGERSREEIEARRAALDEADAAVEVAVIDADEATDRLANVAAAVDALRAEREAVLDEIDRERAFRDGAADALIAMRAERDAAAARREAARADLSAARADLAAARAT